MIKVLVLARNYWGCLCTRFIASVGMLLFDIFIPVLLSQFLDQIIYYKDTRFVSMCIPIILLLAAGHITMMIFGIATWGYLENHFCIDLKEKTVKHLCNMKASSIENYDTQQLLQILNDDVEEFMQVLVRNISNAIIYTVYCIIIIVALYRLNVIIANVCMILIMFNILTSQMFIKKGRKEEEALRYKKGIYKDWVIDHVKGMYDIINLNLKSNIRLDFKIQLNMYAEARNKANIWNELFNKACDLFKEITKIAIYFFGILLVIQGKVMIGIVAAFISYYVLLYTNLSKLLNIAYDYSVRKIHIKKVFSLWQEEKETDSGCKEISDISEIAVCNMFFGYDDKCMLYKDASLLAKKGEIINIIGENGNGKSTFLNILFRLYIENKGEILIDNYNINQFSISAIRRNVAYFSQNFGFLSGVIKEVLSRGCFQAEIDDDKIYSILKRVKLLDRIMLLEKRIYTHIDDYSRFFSLGEIQRLLLANIIIRSSPVVILDEATANLDEATANDINSIINVFSKNKIVINVTHSGLIYGENCRTYLLQNQRFIEV